MEPSQTPPPPHLAPPQQVGREVHYYHSGPSAGTAVALEILLGMFMQTFGVGNLYAGNTSGGLFMMFGYWGLQFVNLVLCLVLIGFVTLPMTWLAFMIFCPIMANGSAKQRAYESIMQQKMMDQQQLR